VRSPVASRSICANTKRIPRLRCDDPIFDATLGEVIAGTVAGPVLGGKLVAQSVFGVCVAILGQHAGHSSQ